MKDLHPSTGAGDGKPQPRIKLSAPYEKKERVVNCPHCGFPNNTLVMKTPDEQGNSNKIVSAQVFTDAGVKTKYEKQVTAGCRNCGLHPEQSSYDKPLFSTVNLQGR